MEAKIKLDAEKREKLGRGAARELRRNNRIPAIIYSSNLEPISVSLAGNVLTREYLKGAFSSKLIELTVDGKNYFALARDIQTHPVSDDIEHVDFLQVTKGEEVVVKVPVKITGRERSLGIRRGGSLNIVRHTVKMLCNPGNIPSSISVDVSGAVIGDSIHISDITLPEGARPYISDRDFTLATIAGRLKAEEKPEGETASSDESDDDDETLTTEQDENIEV